MVDDINPHIIGITESWANNDKTYVELGQTGYVMFGKDIMGRMSAIIHQWDYTSINNVQLHEEADSNKAIWCKLVTGHTTVTIGVVYRCPNITKQNNEKIHNVISEVRKGDCIIMGDFMKNLAHLDWNDKMKNKTATECWNIFKSELDMFLWKSRVSGPRRNICQKRLSERLDINKISGGCINIWEKITIMMFTKRH